MVEGTSITVSNSSVFELVNVTLRTSGTEAIAVKSSSLLLLFQGHLMVMNCTVVVEAKLVQTMTAISFRSSDIALHNSSSIIVNQLETTRHLLTFRRNQDDLSHVILILSTSISVLHGSSIFFANSSWRTNEVSDVNLVLIMESTMLLASTSTFLLDNLSLQVTNGTTSGGGCFSILHSAIGLSGGALLAIRDVAMNSGSTFGAMTVGNSTLDFDAGSKWTLSGITFSGCGTFASVSCLAMKGVSIWCRGGSICQLSSIQFFPVFGSGSGQGSGIELADSRFSFESGSEWIISDLNLSAVPMSLRNVSVLLNSSSAWMMLNMSELILKMEWTKIKARTMSNWTWQNVTGVYFSATSITELQFEDSSKWFISFVSLKLNASPLWSSVASSVNFDSGSSITVANRSNWIVEDSEFVALNLDCYANFLLGSTISIGNASSWIIQRSLLNGTTCSVALLLNGQLTIDVQSSWVIQFCTFFGDAASIAVESSALFLNDSWFGVLSNRFETSLIAASRSCLFFSWISCDSGSYVSYVFNNCTSPERVFGSGSPIGIALLLYKCNWFNDAPQQSSLYPSGSVSFGSCSSVCNKSAECYRYRVSNSDEPCSYPQSSLSTTQCPCLAGGSEDLCLPSLLSAPRQPHFVDVKATRTVSLSSLKTETSSHEAATSTKTYEATLLHARMLSPSRSPSWTSSTYSTSPMTSATITEQTSASQLVSPSISLHKSRSETPLVLPVPEVIRSIASTTAQQAAATAVALSAVTAAVAGPSGATDVQAIAVLLLLPCKSDGKTKPSGYRSLSPVALGDSAAEVLAGNALACSVVAALQLLSLGAFRALDRNQHVLHLMEKARFPGILLTVTASLFQGSLVTSVALITKSSSEQTDVAAGIAGLCCCVALPVFVAFAVRRVPRRFVKYVFLHKSSYLYKCRMLLPVGVVLPSAVRKTSSALICGIMCPSVMFAIWPFLSPLTLTVVSLVPTSAPRAACQAALWISCAIHVALAAGIVRMGVHRSLTAQVLSACGLLLTAVGHLLIASNASIASTDALMLVQSVFSILRCVAFVLMFVFEGKMMSSATVALATKAKWLVGDGGASFEPHLFSALQQEEHLADGKDTTSSNIMIFAPQTMHLPPMGIGSCSSTTAVDERKAAAIIKAVREASILREHDVHQADESSRAAAACFLELRHVVLSSSCRTFSIWQGLASHDEDVVDITQRRATALRLLISCIAHMQREQRLRILLSAGM